MQNKVICIVGMAGAGKTTIADTLVENGFKFLRFGQITLDELKKNNIQPTEERERKIRENFRKKYGMGAFATLNIPKLDRLLKESNVVVDGLYSWSEYKILKEKYGNSMYVICVYAPPDYRYQRITKRSVKGDKDLRFRNFTKEEAEKRDYAEIENIEKGGPIAMADFTIVNIGKIDELKEKTKESLFKIINQ